MREVYRSLIARLMQHFTLNQAAFFLLIKEVQRMMIEGEEAKAVRLMRRRDEILGIMAGPLEAAMEAGTLRRLPVEPVVHTIMGNVKGILMYLNPPPGCEAPAEAPWQSIDEVADFLTTVLFDGMCVHPPPENALLVTPLAHTTQG